MEDYEVEYNTSDIQHQLDRIDAESGRVDKYDAAGLTGIALWAGSCANIIFNCDFPSEEETLNADYGHLSADPMMKEMAQTVNSYNICAADFAVSTGAFEAEATTAIGLTGIAIALGSLGASKYFEDNDTGVRQDLEELKKELETK